MHRPSRRRPAYPRAPVSLSPGLFPRRLGLGLGLSRRHRGSLSVALRRRRRGASPSASPSASAPAAASPSAPGPPRNASLRNASLERRLLPFPPGLDRDPSHPPGPSATGPTSPKRLAAPAGRPSSRAFRFFSASFVAAARFLLARVTRISRSPIFVPSSSNAVRASPVLRKRTKAMPLPRLVFRSRTTRTASTAPESSGYSLFRWNSRITSSSSTA